MPYAGLGSTKGHEAQTNYNFCPGEADILIKEKKTNTDSAILTHVRPDVMHLCSFLPTYH